VEPRANSGAIQELSDKGEDLSWRHISTRVDPQLAAAATKLKHFGSWRSAVSAAGLDYGQIRRYREWDEQTITNRAADLHRQGVDLNAKHMEEFEHHADPRLRVAASIAGIERSQRQVWITSRLVLRSPFKRRRASATGDTVPAASRVSARRVNPAEKRSSAEASEKVTA